MISPSSLSAFSVTRPATQAAPPALAASRGSQVASAISAVQPPVATGSGQRPAQPDPTARRGSLLDRMA
ncbi:hypothetical protein [Lichenicoccus roseus]|uniref:Uncharacterized protein n=1 Tax=Lichenicoccus roseus TaxID=2683649 RepID=A0A5R9J713_9PROT|nr:hypothetical protein [Lichenicoccus roseus]TLU73420.1 hypothetical protein FE263_08495 [Lichenicoccus roseus]